MRFLYTLFGVNIKNGHKFVGLLVLRIYYSVQLRCNNRVGRSCMHVHYYADGLGQRSEQILIIHILAIDSN